MGSKHTLTPPTYFQGVRTPSTPMIYPLPITASLNKLYLGYIFAWLCATVLPSPPESFASCRLLAKLWRPYFGILKVLCCVSI